MIQVTLPSSDLLLYLNPGFDSKTRNANLFDLKLLTRVDPTSHNVCRVLGSAQNTAAFLTAGFTKFFEIQSQNHIHTKIAT